MPGLFGVVTGDRGLDAEAAFEAVFRPAVRRFRSESRTGATGWAAGRTHLGVLQPAPQLAADQRLQVLLHGDVYNLDELARLAGIGADQPAPIDVIAGLYRRFGAGFARHLDGAWCAAVIDGEARRLVLAADSIGSYPLYWSAVGRSLVFGSEVRAVLRHPGVRRSLDPAAVADYITFGLLFGHKTLAAGVQLVPPGSALVYDWETGHLQIERFDSPANWFGPWDGSHASYIEAASDAFQLAARRALAGGHQFGLSLSGGLDSRAILGALNGQASGLATYTLGVKGCADEVIGARLARIAGTRHAFYELDDRYLRDFIPNLRQMVSLTDGMYLSHGLTEMLALGFLRQAPFSVLVRGHGGELAKTDLAWPLHTDDRVRALRSTQALAAYLEQRANYVSAGLRASDLFTESWATQIEGAARRSLEEALAGVDLPPPEACSLLYLTQHHRRFTVASLELFREAVDIRLPFVDAGFLRVLFRGRADWRANTDIHRAATAAGNPALLRVRNSNTGAPAGAGPIVTRALDKVNSLFKRLNVPGYRHYHRFDRWMREQLLSSVETVLLSRASLDRGILREQGLRRLLDDTRAGRADRAYLLQVLLILELWQQENL